MSDLYITVEYGPDNDIQGIYHGFEKETAIAHFESLTRSEVSDVFIVLYQVDIDEDDLEELSEDEEYDYVADIVFSDLSPEKHEYILAKMKN